MMDLLACVVNCLCVLCVFGSWRVIDFVLLFLVSVGGLFVFVI